ncbi:MAG: hypothetical protein WC313_00105 [Candidatus Kapaibacterium sp.]
MFGHLLPDLLRPSSRTERSPSGEARDTQGTFGLKPLYFFGRPHYTSSHGAGNVRLDNEQTL